MPRLRYTTFDGVEHTHELKAGTTRIGRTAENDLQIDELALSSHHLEIECDGQSMILRDLDSFGGTFLDGEPVTEKELRPGQVISMGTFLIQVEESARERAKASSPDAALVQLPDGSYSCLRHADRRALFECDNCFDLACGDCVRVAAGPEGSTQAFCKNCGSLCPPIDWSGLEMTKKEALKELLIPDKVKQALSFWNQHKDKLNSIRRRK